MKSTMLALFLCASGAWAADEVVDRAAIEKTIAGLTTWPARPTLFTADFDDFDTLARVMKVNIRVNCPEVWPETCVSNIPVYLPTTAPDSPGHIAISKEPMGEASWIPPGSPWPVEVRPFKATSIRFVTPDAAVVDADGKGPVLFVMKREGSDWKIASLRILAPYTRSGTTYPLR